MTMMHPSCWFNRHAPVRKAAKWTGYNYIGVCRHCGAQIRRVSHKHWVHDASVQIEASPPGWDEQDDA